MLKNLNIVILAAGLGKRMNSSLPKVLHKIASQTLLGRVINTASTLHPDKIIIVYGHGGELVKDEIERADLGSNLIWVKQEQQLGTGDALKTALPYLDNTGACLVLYGDVPLIKTTTLSQMLANYCNNLILLTANLNNPTGYGRIIRDQNKQLVEIIEDKDATLNQKLITEINSGIYLFPNQFLAEHLGSLTNNNAQKEYYLTDMLKLAIINQLQLLTINATDPMEIMGVNNKVQLEELERYYQLTRASELLVQGVNLADKTRIDIRGKLKAGAEVEIDINCIFEGEVQLGSKIKIGANVIIKDSIIEDNVEIKPNSIIENSVVKKNAVIGPFARIRPESTISEYAHIGNFVEIKKSIIGNNSKINHLTYIGDAEIGSSVNVGAGSVTCNYDGTNKYKTIIKDQSFIGSGTMMVAPVTINQGSIIGAGSVITKNTPANELTLTRSPQTTIYGWKSKYKKDTK